jgi:hypothetical protein
MPSPKASVEDTIAALRREASEHQRSAKDHERQAEEKLRLAESLEVYTAGKTAPPPPEAPGPMAKVIPLSSGASGTSGALDIPPPPKPSLLRAAIEVLREAGRPLHATSQIVPILEARGYVMSHKSNLASAFGKCRDVEKVGVGTFALKEWRLRGAKGGADAS